MPRKVFVAGEILTASDVNTNLMDQSVMVFDDATDRATAIPTPVEGMTTYLKDTDLVEVFDGSDFVPVAIEPDPPAILQVVSTAKTDTFSMSGATFTAVTGMAATITPTSTSNKVLVLLDAKVSNSGTSQTDLRLMRDSTPIYVGDAAGARIRRSSGSHGNFSTNTSASATATVLDSPNATGAVTYSVQMASGGDLSLLNRSGSDNDATFRSRDASSLTLMEVAG